MSDQESSGFSVVDRRTATGSDTPGAPESSANEANTAAAPNDETIASQTATEPNEASAASETSEASSSSAESDVEREGLSMPDPAALLGFAAMQMETPELVALLIAVFDGHAWRALGLVADPASGETRAALPTAQMAIDCVQFLLTKIEASLPDAQKREAQRRLTDLRMNYLRVLRESEAASTAG